MGPKPGHEADETGTATKTASKMRRCKKSVHTHIDSANPFRFLGGTESSPFFPYCWLLAGSRTVRTRYAHCGPNKDQGDGEDISDLHTSGARERADVGQKFWTIYYLDCLTDGASKHP